MHQVTPESDAGHCSSLRIEAIVQLLLTTPAEKERGDVLDMRQS